MTDSSQSPKTSKPLILLDMDGTILDLAFDNFFWQTHVIEHYAKLNKLSPEEALASLVPKFAETRGTLEWYCIDYWSEQLGFSIADLKTKIADKVCLRSGSIAFLQWAQENNFECWLVTNAHPNTLTIKLKQVDISNYFSYLISSHDIGFPKEHPEFWSNLIQEYPFDDEHCVFVDDTLSVLKAAEAFGIGKNYRVIQPDSTQPIGHCDEFPMVNTLDDLIPVLEADYG